HYTPRTRSRYIWPGGNHPRRGQDHSSQNREERAAPVDRSPIAGVYVAPMAIEQVEVRRVSNDPAGLFFMERCSCDTYTLTAVMTRIVVVRLLLMIVRAMRCE